MNDILNKATVLVLNRNWQAVNVRTPQEAFCVMATNVATGLEIEGKHHMHQSWLHYRSLGLATQAHRPDVVAIVGDALHAFPISFKRQFTTAECAKILAKLPVEHLIFVRGNHEDSNWTQFVSTWPHERRKLTALYGAACTIGPLVIVGFPCMTGSELHWCAHLAAGSNDMELRPAQSREPLPADPEAWLPGLMRRLGPAGTGPGAKHNAAPSRRRTAALAWCHGNCHHTPSSAQDRWPPSHQFGNRFAAFRKSPTRALVQLQSPKTPRRLRVRSLAGPLIGTFTQAGLSAALVERLRRHVCDLFHRYCQQAEPETTLEENIDLMFSGA